MNLHKNVAQAVATRKDKSIEQALSAAFLVTDVQCQTALKETTAGSTAVVVMVKLMHKKRIIFTANCGDARAVLGLEKGCERLSFVSIVQLPKTKL